MERCGERVGSGIKYLVIENLLSDKYSLLAARFISAAQQNFDCS
jgi:hypothetical protein